MKTHTRKFYKDLEIGQEVTVQMYYGRLTDNFYNGIIRNKDGQNIVVETQNHRINSPKIDGDIINMRDFEAANPEFAVVTDYFPGEA